MCSYYCTEKFEEVYTLYKDPKDVAYAQPFYFKSQFKGWAQAYTDSCYLEIQIQV